MPNIDLTTLPGWSSLSTGSHNITIVAKADGYRDSEPSAGVFITKGEIEDPLAGTWVFNDSLSYGSFSSFNYSYNINFTSNGTTYNELSSPDPGALPNIGIDLCYGSTTVYNTKSGWTNTAYKTITITSKLSEVTNGDTLLAWLQSNATKQGTGYNVSLKIASDYWGGSNQSNFSYSFDDGVTWTAVSEQNTYLTNVTQIKLKFDAESAGLSLYQSDYDSDPGSRTGTELVFFTQSAYESDNIILTADTGFNLVCEWD